MNRKISVIVPVYNNKDTVKLCVDSILNQSYENFEVLLIDDGSSDGSANICDSYVEKDNRVKAYHKENGGLSDARNYGLDRISGEFVSFIDSDDMIHQDFLLEAIKCFKTYDADIVSNKEIQFTDYKEIEKINTDGSETVINGSDNVLKNYLNPDRKNRIPHDVCSKVFKADLFDNLRFEKGRLHEDLFITYRLLEKCNRFVLTGKTLYFYFKGNNDSICKNYDITNLKDQIDAVENMRLYFKNNEDLKDELRYFVINQYYHWYKKSYELDNSKEVIEKREFMKNEIKKNITKCGILGIADKLKIMIKMVLK